MRLGLISVLWLALSGAAVAQEGSVASCSHIEADGTRTLCHERVLPASVQETWVLFATSEGLRSWLAPVAAIDLRVGGIWEVSYDPAARLGDPGNIRSRILSYVPERMISIQIAETPPGFPDADRATRLWTVIELEPVGADETRVRVSMLGYGDGDADQALYNFFERGNGYTLEKLRERIGVRP